MKGIFTRVLIQSEGRLGCISDVAKCRQITDEIKAVVETLNVVDQPTRLVSESFLL